MRRLEEAFGSLYWREEAGRMLSALRFWWNATRGHRFRPWRSPYMRWRIETFSGVKADQVDRHLFFQFLWQQRRQLVHFLRWTGEMRDYAAGREPK